MTFLRAFSRDLFRTGWSRRRIGRRRAVLEALEGRTLLSISLSPTSWTEIGPAPITGQAGNGNVGNGTPTDSGRIAGIAADPTNAGVIYVASAGGGVWKTVDGGQTWSPLTDHVTDSSGQPVPEFMGAIAVAPSNPQVIYAGTGEANFSGDSFYGDGVLKSTDGGADWTLEGEFDQNNFPLFQGTTISKIVVDPNDANTVYVAIAGSGVNGNFATTGIYESQNGGTTWTDTTTAISTFDAFTDLVMDPANPQTLYAAVGTPAGDASNGVYQTTNGGTTWAAAGNFPMGAGDGRIALAIAPSSPTTLYASIAQPATINNPGSGLLSLEKSTDGGTTWNNVTNDAPNYLGTQGSYDTALVVNNSNPNIVYAGGQAASDSSKAVIESQDGGAHWSDITDPGGATTPHTDHHAFAFDANGKLLDGNDGGIWRLDNNSTSSPQWTDLNGNAGTGLGITEFTGIALDPSDPDVAYGGSQDNGTEKFTGSLEWDQVQGGDGGFVRVNPNNTQTIYHTFGWGTATDSKGAYDEIERSDNGGATWTNITAGISSSDQSNFYPPYVIDPSNHLRLVLGTNRVYESTNQGNSWTAISTPNTNGWNTAAPIDSIAIAPSDSNTIYASAGNQTFVTTDDGAHWKERDVTGFGSLVRDIVVDPTDSQTAYAVMGNFSIVPGGHVLMTTDGGQFWSDISVNLPNVPTWSIALDTRAAAHRIYVGTDVGVYASNDGGDHWVRFMSGFPDAQVVSLDLDPNLGILAAGTHGRGMWEIEVPVNTQITETVTSSSDSGLGTLREAITNADFDVANTYIINFAVNEVDLTGALPDLTNTISIEGPGVGNLTVQRDPGAPPFSVFAIDSGATETISDLTISGGEAIGDPGDPEDGPAGGGIVNRGSLLLIDCTLSGNTATYGGGLCNYAGFSGGYATADLIDCIFTGNSATAGGALANDETLTISGCILTGNSAGVNGGALQNDGSAQVVESTISGNTALNGGGVQNVLGGSLTIDYCTLYGNSAYTGGAVDNLDATVTIEGNCLLQSNSATFGGGLANVTREGASYMGDAVAAVSDCTLSGNSAGNAGGGVWNSGHDGAQPAEVTISDCTLSDDISDATLNSAGGGVENVGGGSVTIENSSTLLDDISPLGGGIDNDSASTVVVTGSSLQGNTAAVGGGIHSAGALTITSSTLLGNQGAFDGGAIANSGNATVGSCTISGNTCRNNLFGFVGGDGGGIYNQSGGLLTISFSFVEGNTAGGSGGGIASAGTLEVDGATIQGNEAGDLGGGVESGGVATLSFGTVSGNSAGQYGGGAANDFGGSMTMGTVVVSDNQAGVSGGGISNDGGLNVNEGTSIEGNTASSDGGGVYDGASGVATLSDDILFRNTALGDGGGVNNTGRLSVVSGTLLEDNVATAGGGVDDEVGGTASISLSSFDGNSTLTSIGLGGAIDNSGRLTFNNSTVAGNAAGFGGGLENGAGATATVSSVGFSFDTAGFDGGGINNSGTLTVNKGSSFSGDSAGSGGGLANEAGGKVTISGARLTSNSAGDNGGGIDNAGTLTLNQNSNLFRNTAGNGGGIDDEAGGSATVAGDTILNNSAVYGGGIDSAGTLKITASTIGGNSAVIGGGVENSGTLTMSGASALSGNQAGLLGGGLDNDTGKATIYGGSQITGNTAGTGGGGIENLGGTLTVTGASVTGNVAAVGGGISSDETLTINGGSNISNNTATAFGGGIDNAGVATITACSLQGNTAADFGGGIYNPGTLTINGSTLSANTASMTGPGGTGGGIENAGTLNLNNSTLSGNTAGTGGGGLNNEAGVQATVSGSTFSGNTAGHDGGGIDNAGTLTIIKGSTLSQNTATYGGGLANELGGTVTIGGSTIAANTGTHAGGGIDNAGTATVSGTIAVATSTVSGNWGLFGGGAWNNGALSVTTSSVSANTSGLGAGILNTGYGILTISGSTLGGNTSLSEAGALGNEGRATVTSTTISGNRADSAGAGCDDDSDSGGLTLINCTVANNTAETGGGGIFNYPSSILKVSNSTIAGNATMNPNTNGGGLDNLSGGVAMIFDTIVATNTATGSGPDVSGVVTSSGHNLIGNSSGGSGFVASDLLNLNPLLAALGNYGGPTASMTLLPGSPAIDAGDNTNAPATDQRGFSRIVNHTIDIGADECRGFTISITSGNNQSATINTAFAAPLVVTVASSQGEPVQGGVVTFTAPSSGASTNPPVNTATIGASKQASVSVTANGVAGGYVVSASAGGVANPAHFRLTNSADPAVAVATHPHADLLDPILAGPSFLVGGTGGGAEGSDQTLIVDLAVHDAALAQWYGLADADWPRWIAIRKDRVSTPPDESHPCPADGLRGHPDDRLGGPHHVDELPRPKE